MQERGLAKIILLVFINLAGFVKTEHLVFVFPVGFAKTKHLVSIFPVGFTKTKHLVPIFPAGFTKTKHLASIFPAGFAKTKHLVPIFPVFLFFTLVIRQSLQTPDKGALSSRTKGLCPLGQKVFVRSDKKSLTCCSAESPDSVALKDVTPNTASENPKTTLV
jgi:hypothetical protein